MKTTIRKELEKMRENAGFNDEERWQALANVLESLAQGMEYNQRPRRL